VTFISNNVLSSDIILLCLLSEKGQSNVASSDVWLQPNLRVRIVDESYRRGKYFKTKVICSVMKISGSTLCVLINILLFGV